MPKYPKRKKRNERILLPAGCSMSSPSIHPFNWKQNPSVSKDWYIQYRFYDPVHRPAGKQVIVKGMNDFKTFQERKLVTERLLSDEIAMLRQGYNPVTDSWSISGELGELEEFTPLTQALRIAFNKLACDEKTIGDARSMLNWVPIAIEQLNWQHMPIREVRKKHIRRILDQCATIKSRVDPESGKTVEVIWSNHKYNKYRSYLMILFSEIVEAEAIDANPCKDIKKKKTTKRPIVVLTKEQRILVDNLLQVKDRYFWRFLHIFFHSGARETEIMALQGKHVFLEKQTYLRLVKKDSDFRWVETTIKDIALPLWAEALEECGKEDFLFSVGFKPGARKIREEQIARRWRRKVKKPLSIEADFYKLKHLNTTQTASIAGDDAAAAHNAHRDTAMVVKIYDVDRGSREHEAMKKVNNPFAGS